MAEAVMNDYFVIALPSDCFQQPAVGNAEMGLFPNGTDLSINSSHDEIALHL